MPTTFSSRDFNQDVARAKKAALTGPVLVTDRGRPTHVLLSFEAYTQLQTVQPTLDVLLGMPDGDDIDFEPARLGDVTRPVEL
ncbi:type II toxin-antitoxin system Phd/YefM family antitoxin [Xanthobacter aminoxidans]|uniref:Antitoxin n=1 Tax=Xanthobacter aminoxidans TaxID=186280 RepID=A0ABW6ZRG7_9HYPH